MKSAKSLGKFSISLPLVADDIEEFHAARLLLLIYQCGAYKERINGLTKLAKLDFFVRYPNFFSRVAEKLGQGGQSSFSHVESSMVRHHYGPWDKRYYQVIAFLESRNLIWVKKQGNSFNFVLTPLGRSKAMALSRTKAFKPLISQMKSVKKVLGKKSGTQLKELVYEVFETEIKQRKLGEVIK